MKTMRELQAEITWPIAFEAGMEEAQRRLHGTEVRTIVEGELKQAELRGIREEQKRMTKALRELHKQGWTLAEVIEAEDTMGED